MYIADYGNDRIRRVDSTGVITTIAGGQSQNSITSNNIQYYNNIGGPATSVYLNHPSAVGVDSKGTFH